MRQAFAAIVKRRPLSVTFGLYILAFLVYASRCLIVKNKKNEMKLDALTSLRFFFAMMVFCAHCYVLDDTFAAHVFKEGFVGVNFFFILSGFIIAYNYQHKMEDGQVTRRDFWVARIARVYPLHWLTLVVAAAWGGYVTATDGWDWLRHFFASFTLTNAYVPHVDYFFSFNSPSWSLCCEQLFYFCFPLLLPLTRRPRLLSGVFLVCVLLVVSGMYFTPEADIKAYWYVNPLTRFPDFIVGLLLFRLYEKMKHCRLSVWTGSLMEVGSLVVFLAFYQLSSDIPKVYRYSCYYWLPIAFVLGSFALQRGVLSRMLSNRFLVVGGEISYSFYLIHLMVLLPYAEWQQTSGLHVAWYVSVPLLWTFIMLLSLLSYRCFEKPVNRWVKALLGSRRATAA